MKLQLSFIKRIFLCFLSAGLVWFSFPNFIAKTLTPSTAFLGWVALVPFFIALHETTPRQGAFFGWLFGFAQFGGILYWIAFLEAAHYLSGPAWAVLVFYLSLYFLVFGWAFRFLEEKLKFGNWVAPCLWVALEYIRGSRPWGGFSWGELGYSQAAYPLVLTLVAWTGVYGLTFLMVWFNSQIAQWVVHVLEEGHDIFSRVRSFWMDLLVPLGVIGLVLASGQLELKTAVITKAGTVSLLQPSINQDEKWSNQNETATFDKLERLVRAAEVSKPNLIVWPETAAPAYLLWNRIVLNRVVAMVRRSKTFQLVGCLDALRKGKEIHCYNAAVQFAPDGRPNGIYHKHHLVPFGEFVPFQKYISFLGPVVGDLGSFDTGEKYQKFQVNGFSYTPMICYEVIFPGDVYKAFQTGADVLVNISNDAWYGRTASPYQHAMMAVVRSAEERKPLLRAANTGVCLATDPFGRILCSTGLFEVTQLTADVLVTASAPPTLYSRWGNWFPRLCWFATVFLFLAGFFKRRSQSPVPSSKTENHAT